MALAKHPIVDNYDLSALGDDVGAAPLDDELGKEVTRLNVNMLQVAE